MTLSLLDLDLSSVTHMLPLERITEAASLLGQVVSRAYRLTCACP